MNDLNESSPIAIQPIKIITKLKPHQLATLYKAMQLEQEQNIEYIEGETISKITVNIGLLGDLVGYGKTLSALAIIANNEIEKIHSNDILTSSYTNCDMFHNNRYTFNSMTITRNVVNMPTNNDYINTTLVIVPRGPVYTQWVNTLKEQTTLKYLAIDNVAFINKYLLKKTETTTFNDIKTYFESFDLVLIKNTTLNNLINEYLNFDNDSYDENASQDARCSSKCLIKRWARIMIDESHEIINSINTLSYKFLWLISGTYELMKNRSYFAYKKIIYNIHNIISNELKYILVKGESNFVQRSFDIPQMIEINYQCKLSAKISIIKSLLNEKALEKLNGSDIPGLVKELGGTNIETEEEMILLVTKNLQKHINNKKCEIKYFETIEMDIVEKVNRINNITNDIVESEKKLNVIIARISELPTKTCSICIDIIENPIILECMHIFCGKCLLSWIARKSINYANANCPECRVIIDSKKLINISKKCKEEKQTQLNKEETLIKIIQNKTAGKFLIFSKIDNGFAYIKKTLTNANMEYKELKGTTNVMLSILNQFKTGDLNIILLNTKHAGSGIDISFATDIIIYHNMGEDKIQAIGRGQRVGRTNSLTVHNLLYAHEN